MAANSLPNGFNLSNFTAGQVQAADAGRTRYERDMARLTRAAWGTGRRLASFRAAAPETQESMVLDWTQEAMQFAEDRRARKEITV